jgi:hypothetical protein
MLAGKIRRNWCLCERRWTLIALLIFYTVLSLSATLATAQDNNAPPKDRTTRKDSTFSIEYEMTLEPFQVFLEYDDKFPMAKSDEMVVLSSTQSFLSSQIEETEPDFVRLVLYQYVRDYIMETQGHYSKIAMNGMVFFASPITDDLRSRVVNQIFRNMSADSNVYVDILRSNGMNHVVNATLLSMQGNEMMYQDGAMVEMINDPESTGSETEASLTNATITRDMGNDMKNTVLLLCLIIPVAVILLAATVFILRFAREVNWSGVSHDEKLWHCHEVQHAAKKGKKSSWSNKNSDTGDSSRGRDDISEDLSDISFEVSTEV